MNKHWKKVKPVILLLIAWRILLEILGYFSTRFFSLREGFLGITPWANMDGVHYLSIAEHGYFQYENAFFPFYPFIIRTVSRFFHVPYLWSGLLISHLSFVIGVGVFFLLARRTVKQKATEAVCWLLLFPTSFFFVSVYSESIFFLFSVLTIYFVEERKWVFAGVFGMFASATRLFGILLFAVVLIEYIKERRKKLIYEIGISFIPLGLIAYMVFLTQETGDPLAFFHVQPAFGAERSGSSMILLPQVLWRYVKIIITANPTTIQYGVAIFEFGVFLFSLWLLWLCWKKKMRFSYILYSLLVIFIPTLTGTLSSFPRYFLSAFPLFFILTEIKGKSIKQFIRLIFLFGLILCTSLFIRGYFIA